MTGIFGYDVDLATGSAEYHGVKAVRLAGSGGPYIRVTRAWYVDVGIDGR